MTRPQPRPAASTTPAFRAVCRTLAAPAALLALAAPPAASALTVQTGPGDRPAQPAAAPTTAPYSIADILSPGYPVELVAARSADRIAWIEYEEGRRNVWTAAAPGYAPVRLTRFEDDDGRDLSGLRISADGGTLVFLRGHTPNRDGWIANPASDPRGAERAVWAVSSSGGEPWRVAEAWNATLSPDGQWVAYSRDGAIYRAPVNPGARVNGGAAAGDRASADGDPAPLFSVFGRQSGPVWSPDSRRIAFVSDRGDHSFIGVYDTHSPSIVDLGPGVDRDSSPTWSPDGARRQLGPRRSSLPRSVRQAPGPPRRG